MPFFFILPVWLFCVVLGLGLVAAKQTRFLSTYLIFCSTGGLILSVLFSILTLWLATKFTSGHDWMKVVVLIAILASTPFGGLLGALAGFFVARSVNSHLGWTLRENYRPSHSIRIPARVNFPND